MKVVVLGLWHLGSVTVACAAEHFFVTGIDFDPERITGLGEGRAPLSEPGLDDLLKAGLLSGRLSFSLGVDASALAAADILWVCEDTPVDDHDVPNADFVLQRLEQCLPALRAGAVVLLSSQLPAGTCRALAKKHPRFAFACSPENLRLGHALEIFRKPDRVVIGASEEDTRDTLRKLFAPFAADKIIWMSPTSAEMTKHGINAFLALSVTFANELAGLCEEIGADAREVETGLRSESRIGPKAYLRPGGAFAGGTLARDVVGLTQLARAKGANADLLSAILSSNNAHGDWPLRRLRSLLGSLKGKTIAVLGLTYKAGTDTLRRSRAVELVAALIKEGAQVQAYDPAVRTLPADISHARLCTGLDEALREADAAVIATEWPQIREADWAELFPLMRQRLIIDANRFLKLPPGADLKHITVGSL